MQAQSASRQANVIGNQEDVNDFADQQVFRDATNHQSRSVHQSPSNTMQVARKKTAVQVRHRNAQAGRAAAAGNQSPFLSQGVATTQRLFNLHLNS